MKYFPRQKTYVALLTLALFKAATSFAPTANFQTSRNELLTIQSKSSTALHFFNNNKGNSNDEMNNNDEKKPDSDTDDKKSNLSQQLRRSFLISTAVAGVANIGFAFAAPPNFKRIPTQFIAALGDPTTNTGSNANDWGIWTVDPGPRGVYLRDYEKYIKGRDGVAPAGWKFKGDDWWLEEHGLIMEAPDFPLSPGKYLVTGGRRVTTTLEIDEKGNWKLQDGSLYDVTHLPCRSARYTPGGLAASGKEGSPLTAKQSDFPVKPGAEMPKVDGCEKLDYAVLFVIGKEVV